MTSYALFVGETRPVIIAVWATGSGGHATTVCPWGPSVEESAAAELCEGLTRLSEALWACRYLATPSAASDEESVDLHEHGVDGAEILQALREPNIPDDAGYLVISYHPAIEAAHEVGRLVRDIGDVELADAVVAEVTAEIRAVDRAGLGDLRDRAVQAVRLNHVDPSPVQVAAADAILRDHPLGDALLWTAVDPAAACVAAAHWLAAATQVIVDVTGVTPLEVFAWADDLEAGSVQVPSLVVDAVLGEGVQPRQVVVDVLLAARAAAEGRVPDPAALVAAVDAARAQAERLPVSDRDVVMAGLLDRVSLVDPRRPSRDLLDHLLDGLRACLLVFCDTDQEDEDPADAEDHRETFLELVRAQADQVKARLV